MISVILARIAHLYWEEFGFNDQLRSEQDALVSALVAFESILPPLDDPWGIEPFESLSLINPRLIITHTTYHGSRLILHSLRAKEDPSSRLKVFAAAQSLVGLCSQLRGARGLRRVHAPLILLVSVACLLYLLAPSLPVTAHSDINVLSFSRI